MTDKAAEGMDLLLPQRWASVTVGYNSALKLDMNQAGTWEAIRALYWGQLHADNSRGFQRIEIVPWPEDKNET